MVTSQDFRLIRLNKEQYDIADRTNYFEWGAPVLTIEQYLDREHSLRKLQFRPIGWALVKIDECPHTTLNILATCETFQRPCIIKDGDGKVKYGDCVAIASVFTQPQHRKNGYATQMMKLLQEEIRAWPDVIASTLYSDIGPVFYDRLGWKVFPSVSYEIPVENWSPLQSRTVPTSTALDIFMDSPEAKQIIKSDIKRIMLDVENGEIGKTTFALLPSFDALEWHFTRSIIYAKHLNLPTPKRCGAHIGSSFFLWAPNWSDKALYVIGHYLENEDDASTLLNLAVEEARAMDLPKVCIWDPHTELLKLSEKNAFRFDSNRTSSLSSAVFFDCKQSPSQWIHNEKFYWV